MRIMTLNVNGIRSATQKGLLDYLAQQQFDVVCLQEMRIQAEQLAQAQFTLPGYQRFAAHAEKKGYSGVSIYTRLTPDRVVAGLGFPEADQEGRYLQVDFGQLSVASIYLPSGSSGEARQRVKFHFMAEYEKMLHKQLQDGRNYILCGDWNIAHKAIDLKNWRGNQKNSGFLPEERAWLDKLFDEWGYVDAFRLINPAAEQYTWWSNRGQAYAKNVGWRIDYQIISPALKNQVKAGAIYKQQRFSDHAPLVLEY